MVERSCSNCTYCGEPVNEDYNFTLDHTAGIYGEDKDPTIVRKGVFCSRSCLTSWLQKSKPRARGLMNIEQLEILRKRITYIRESADRDSLESRQINLTLDELDDLVLKDLKHLVWKRYLEADEDKEGRGSMVRTPSTLIGEIEHDLDEIATGWSQKEGWRIQMGLGDARRELKELWRAITEAETS